MNQVIAMDGPAASGKSSVAKRVAQALGWVFVNTGNTYRTATLAVLRAKVDLQNEEAVTQVVESSPIEIQVQGGSAFVTLHGESVDAELNSEAVNQAVSHVAKVAAVRAKLVALQRSLVTSHSCVMEGRDIGSVVFPETPFKFYIDASEEVRAVRRGLQGFKDAVAERDKIDATRKASPLKMAEDAILIDSSDLTLDEVVDQVMQSLAKKGLVTHSNIRK